MAHSENLQPRKFSCRNYNPLQTQSWGTLYIVTVAQSAIMIASLHASSWPCSSLSCPTLTPCVVFLFHWASFSWASWPSISASCLITVWYLFLSSCSLLPLFLPQILAAMLHSVSPKVFLEDIFLSVTSCEASSMFCTSSSDFRQRRMCSTPNFHPLNWFLQTLHSSSRGFLSSCSYTGVHSPQPLHGHSRDPGCSISCWDSIAMVCESQTASSSPLLLLQTQLWVLYNQVVSGCLLQVSRLGRDSAGLSS